MIRVALLVLLLNPSAFAQERANSYSEINKAKKNFEMKEADRAHKLFENKELGIFEHEDHCHKDSLEESVLKGLAGVKTSCKKKYYLRLRIICSDQSSPRIAEIPFPRKNITLTVNEKNKGNQILHITSTPENGYIQGLLESKSEFDSPIQALITIEFMDFKKTISSEEAKAPVEVPLTVCLKKK